MKKSIIQINNLEAGVRDISILKGINLTIPRNEVTAILGPSGCGKSTLMRCINRMHELTSGGYVNGEIILKKSNIYKHDPFIIRRKIGMVFQRPNPFPTMSIYENVISGYTLNGIKLKKEEKDEIVMDSLNQVGLWDEVKENVNRKGTFLSGGQQQRLCIARALAMQPKVLLLDEPTSALDPISTTKIEKLIVKLKDSVSIVLVTHNIAQAARISDNAVFLYLGELIEHGPTKTMFDSPKETKTRDYLSGAFG
ncbi:phosphate ABC transporter ATP-binding protein [bacterium]|nr:phosphate ABC transporter ATP-binding protein [bacterium]